MCVSAADFLSLRSRLCFLDIEAVSISADVRCNKLHEWYVCTKLVGGLPGATFIMFEKSICIQQFCWTLH